MINKLITCLLVFINLLFLRNSDASRYIIFEGCSTGMFSQFQMVLSLCQLYENGEIKGGEVNFKKNGFYYDVQKGENWWEYYFEPLYFGKSKRTDICRFNSIACSNIEYSNTRFENFKLIKKYIRLKPHILEKEKYFIDNNFINYYVIGVHYRGTDKKCEAPRVSYETVKLVIEEHIQSLKEYNWKIFVATDEIAFLNYLTTLFPGRVCCNSEAFRSENQTPIHGNYPDAYQGGEEAILDCLLLSKSNILIRTSSNLSLVSTYFNPELSVIELSKRYGY